MKDGWLAAFVLAFAAPSFARPSPGNAPHPQAVFAVADAAKRIDARVREYADAGLFSGVVLVSRGDEIVYQGAFGLADRTLSVPNTTTTRFHIASLSKPITAAAILLLIDRGRLDWETPVSMILLCFPNGDRITIEQLLTHYSGLDDTSSRPDYGEWSKLPQTPMTLVDRLASLPLLTLPGRKYRYGNSNYHLLALIIEQVSGQPYGDFLASNIFAPLGMTSSGHRGDQERIIPELAAGYLPHGVSGFEKPAYLDWTSKTGNGSLYATVGDLQKFHRALQHGGLLKPETVIASYGFGRRDRLVGSFWSRSEEGGHRSVHVGGSSPGYKAYIERFIDDDVAVIVLSNVSLDAPRAIGSDIRAILWGGQGPLPRVPARVRRHRDELDRLAGDYQFGASFFLPDVAVRVEREEDHLLMKDPGGQTVIPLLPIADGFFDRLRWSFVRFEGDKLIYRKGGTVFRAPRRDLAPDPGGRRAPPGERRTGTRP